MRHKLVARIVTLVAATTIAISTTCVTALAADTRTETLVLNGQEKNEDSLYVMLTKDNHNKLTKLATDTVPFVNNSVVAVRLDAKRLKDASATLPDAVTAAEPLLVYRLMLTTQEDSNGSKTVGQVSEPVMLTLQLPSGMERGSYHVTSLGGSTQASVADLDGVPNTITFETASFGDFVVTGNAIAAPKPTQPAPTAPTQPKAPVDSNPTAGGVPDGYAPRTVLAQAVPVAMPIAPTAPEQSGFSSHMAATSMMMTAAFVSGTIDYENSQHEEQPEQEPTVEYTTVEDIFDEDAEEGIEEELEGFRETGYR